MCFILFLAEADEIPSPVTANSTSKNPKDRSVKLTWEEPKNPNGIVIVHEVEFSKVDNTPKQGSNSIEGISSRDANGETISNEVEKKIVVQDTVSILSVRNMVLSWLLQDVQLKQCFRNHINLFKYVQQLLIYANIFTLRSIAFCVDVIQRYKFVLFVIVD